MLTALYRISSGEVIGISSREGQFDTINKLQFTIIEDPVFKNGTDNFNKENPIPREFGYQKIVDREAHAVRNATQEEIDGFYEAETIDVDVMDAVFAKVFMNDHPRFKKLMKATVKVLVDEINVIRQDLELSILDDYEVRKRIKDRIKSDFEI